MTEPPPVLQPAPGSEPRCPACLSLYRPGQRFCLECGARLTEAGLPPPDVARGAPLGTRQRIALAAAALVLVLGGAGIAWIFATDDEPAETVVLSAPAHSIPSLGGLTTEGAETGLPTEPGATEPGLTDPGLTGTDTTLPVTPTESIPEFTDVPTDELPDTEEPAFTDDGADGLDEEPIDEWPSGLDAWAAILISKEVDDFDNAYMEDLRSDAEARGLGSLGLLFSDNYSSLNPGFRVLYQGPFDTRGEADAAAVRAKAAGYDFAYPRRVAP
jgi:hypothetical protein